MFYDGGSATALKYLAYNFLQPMRATPSMTRTGNAVTGSESGTTFYSLSNSEFYLSNSGTAAVGGTFTADAEL